MNVVELKQIFHYEHSKLFGRTFSTRKLKPRCIIQDDDKSVSLKICYHNAPNTILKQIAEELYICLTNYSIISERTLYFEMDITTLPSKVKKLRKM